MPPVNAKQVTVGTVAETPLANAHAVSRSLTTNGILASRSAGMGGRMASTGAAGLAGVGGFSGMPAGPALPSVLATGSPLSVFQYTLSRADRLALYRYFSKVDPFVGRAIELHAELPLSRLSIGVPKGPNSLQNKEINRIYENMTERLALLQFLLDIAREYWMVGDVYIWHEWDDEIQEWEDIYILPVEYCHSILHPFLRRKEVVVFARPLVDTASIRRMTDRDLYMMAGDPDIEHLIEEVEDDLPPDLKEILDYGEGKPLNTDPSKGSFCCHIARNRPPNESYGIGIVERCLEVLLRLENLKNAQLQISGRNMNPKHLIWGEGLSQTELEDLRMQVDLSLIEDVDYPIVTNYPVTWETKGANERLLNVDSEYNTLREDLATGLGSTKELLTGQATYGGQRITLELMNTQYLTFRELIKDYVERCIFRPVAEAKGHYYYEEIDTWVKTKREDLEPGDDIIQEYDGKIRKRQIQVNKVYNHSKLKFNRLSIRDNSEVYEQLFQLHQKGSLALKYLLDLHNIDPEENAQSLLEDLATVRDPVFNRLVEAMYGIAAERVVAETDIVDRVIEGMNLDVKSQSQGEPMPGTDPAGLIGGPGGDIGGVGGDIAVPGTMPGEEMMGDPAAIGLPGDQAQVGDMVPGAASKKASKKIKDGEGDRLYPGKVIAGITRDQLDDIRGPRRRKRLTAAVLRNGKHRSNGRSRTRRPLVNR